MSTKHYCDKCKKEIGENIVEPKNEIQRVTINDGYMSTGSDTSTYSASYDLCKPCLSEIVNLLEDK